MGHRGDYRSCGNQYKPPSSHGVLNTGKPTPGLRGESPHHAPWNASGSPVLMYATSLSTTARESARCAHEVAVDHGPPRQGRSRGRGSPDHVDGGCPHAVERVLGVDAAGGVQDRLAALRDLRMGGEQAVCAETRRAADEDGAAEQLFCASAAIRDDLVADGQGAGRLSPERHFARVAAECGNVLLGPAQSHALVLEAEIGHPGRHRLLAAGKAEEAEPVVEVHGDDGMLFCTLAFTT